MTTKKILYLLLVSLFFMVSCSDDDTDNSIYQETGDRQSELCIVVNQGNFTEANGSIALYHPTTGVIDQEVYTAVNGRQLAATIESVAVKDDILLLLCNSEDKIVFLNSTTMQEIAEPITGIGTPRYGAIKGNKAYVSCWSFTGQEQIAIIDLQSKTLVGSIPANYSMPEAVQIVGDLLFVAVLGGIDVYDTTTNQFIKSIASVKSPNALAQQMVVDKNNRLWVSLGGFYNTDWEVDNSENGFMCINPITKEIITEVSVPNMGVDAEIAISSSKDKIYFISNKDIVGSQSPNTETDIYYLSVDTEKVGTTPVVSGTGFYGIGVDPVSGYIYTANINGFMTNSVMYIYKPTGELVASTISGVGTCRFLFVKGSR